MSKTNKYILALLVIAPLIALRGTVAVNVSESLPIGIYIQKNATEYQPGDIVLFYSKKINQYGEQRGYLKPGTQLGKRIVASSGDDIVTGRTVTVNGKKIGHPAQIIDSQSRPMQIFEYTGKVPLDHVFVLGDTKGSFDSRYYGFVETKNINKKLIPLLIWRNSQS